MRSRIASVAVGGVAFALAVTAASAAFAFPNKTSQCTNCHSADTAVKVTATQTSLTGTSATYAVSVSDTYGDGTTGWTVFDGTVNVANGYGNGSFTVATGKTYKVWGVAGAGGQGANSITISPVAQPPADTTAPSVAITAPTSGSTVSGLVSIAANASDAGSGVARVEFRADGVLLTSDTTAPFAAVWDATAAAPGAHTITATAYDNVGLSTTTSVPVTVAAPVPVDTTAPIVVLTSPATGSTVSGSVAIGANASDLGSGVARVEFRVDGVLLTSDTTSPYSATWNAAAAAAGTHTITATAYDNVGLSATTSVSVTIAPVDTTAPTVTLTSPATGTTVSGNVAIAATASDTGSGVARVEFRVDGTLLSTDATSPYAATWNATAAAPGAHTITATAFDNVGLSTTSTVTVSIAAPVPVDTTAPLVALTAPANGSVVTGTVSIAANASDAGSGVDRVEFLVDGVLLSTDTTSPYTAAWDTTLAAPGTHVISARAFDKVGLSTTTSVSVSIDAPAPVDTTAPVVALSAPADGTTVNGAVGITADATDLDSGIDRVEFFVDGSLLGTDTAAPYAIVWDATGATAGAHLIEVVAYDNAGLSSSTSIQVVIEPPVVVSKSTASFAVSTVEGPLADAKVVLRNTVTGARYVALTDAAGNASFADLPYGEYSATASGKRLVREIVRISIDSPELTFAFELDRR